LDYVIRQGPQFEVRQTTGPHRDSTGTLRLDGRSRTKKKTNSKEGDFPKLGAPAERALAAAEIKTLKQLSRFSEAEIKELHGIGPNALGKLHQALAEKGLSFSDKKKK
jgi:DNA-directed RNA polymerase alpha subunit